jgi:hypothetical protein
VAEPVIKAFREAVDYHRTRSGVSPSAFYAMSDEAKRRAFTISGGLREGAIGEAHALLTRALEENMTREDFTTLLGDILARQDGVLLSPQRMELIWQNAYALAYSAGRYRQLSDPDLIRLRPLRQYPVEPRDGSTTPVCRALGGLVWRAGDPIEKRIWPPNHHGERHLDVISLTEAEARELGLAIYESEEDTEYPVIDGQQILPLDGFDFPPHLLGADDADLARHAAELADELAGHAAADYGLGKLSSVTGAPLPQLTPLVTPDMLEEGWERFRGLIGIPEGATGTWILDASGDGVRLARASYDALVASGLTDMIRAILPAIEEADEVWIVRRADGTLTKRYFKVFAGETPGSRIVLELERAPGGFLVRIARPGRPESRRRGRLASSKLPRARKSREMGLYGARARGGVGVRQKENTPLLKSVKKGSKGVLSPGAREVTR